MDSQLKFLKAAPIVVGDEPAVLRHTRPIKRRRRIVQVAFLGAVAGLATALSVLKVPDILVGTAAFFALSSSFIVLHLAVGKRRWMAPIEAFDQGIAASEVTLLFCRRRFVSWDRVDTMQLVPAEGGLKRLEVGVAGGMKLESVPGEVDDTHFAALEARLAQVRAEYKVAKAIFDSVGKEPEAAK